MAAMIQSAPPPVPDAGVAPSVAPSGPSPIKSKFTQLASRFEAFDKQLLEKKKKQKVDDEQKFVELRAEIEKLHVLLKEEQKKRVETIKALNAWFDDKFNTLRAEIAPPLVARLDALDKEVVLLNEKVEKVRIAREEDKKAFPKQIDERSSQLLKQIDEFKAQYESGEKVRDQKLSEVLKLLTEQEHKELLQFEAERVAREKKFSTLQVQIDKEINVRSTEVRAIQEKVVDNHEKLKVQLESEVKVREAAVEELASTINHYAAALQDAIRTVA